GCRSNRPAVFADDRPKEASGWIIRKPEIGAEKIDALLAPTWILVRERPDGVHASQSLGGIVCPKLRSCGGEAFVESTPLKITLPAVGDGECDSSAHAGNNA